jgi:Bacterial regulatory helix-turn-helix protein, lysR family
MVAIFAHLPSALWTEEVKTRRSLLITSITSLNLAIVPRDSGEGPSVWAVAKEGSLRKASEVLHVSQPSISSQIKQREESLGAPVFARTTRRLILTDTGQTVFQRLSEVLGWCTRHTSGW